MIIIIMIIIINVIIIIIIIIMMYIPLGDNPGGVLILDIKHEEGAVLTGSKEHSVVICEHELRDG